MFEEEKSVLFPQELYIQQQKERQKVPLIKQIEGFPNNYPQESEFTNKILVKDWFVSSDQPMENWELATFSPGSLEKPCDVHSSFFNLHLESNEKGLQLKNQILKLKKELHLLTLACEIKIKFELNGDSTFWILTRNFNIRGAEVTICKFKKEMDSQRVFVIFGANIGRNNEFKFFKKQEIPEVYRNEAEGNPDSVELKVKFTDNGDDRVFLKAIMGKNRNVHMSCDKFIPSLTGSGLMFAGSGESVFIKSCSVKHIPRIRSKSRPSRFECCQVF